MALFFSFLFSFLFLASSCLANLSFFLPSLLPSFLSSSLSLFFVLFFKISLFERGREGGRERERVLIFYIPIHYSNGCYTQAGPHWSQEEVTPFWYSIQVAGSQGLWASFIPFSGTIERKWIGSGTSRIGIGILVCAPGITSSSLNKCNIKPWALVMPIFFDLPFKARHKSQDNLQTRFPL